MKHLYLFQTKVSMIAAKVGILILFLLSPTMSFATLLTSGQTLNYEFSNLSYSASMPWLNQGDAVFNFVGDLFDYGDIYRIDLFEDNLNSTPFFSHVWDAALICTCNPADLAPNPNVGASGLNAWQDLQGWVSFTVLAGSINVDSIDIQVVRGTDFLGTNQIYGSLFSHTESFADPSTPVVSVPEPSSVALLALGLAGLGLGRRRNQKSASA